MKHASIGSIIHSTLRTQDLLETFASELEYHIKRNWETFDKDTLYKLGKLLGAANHAVSAGGEVTELHDELTMEIQDELDTFAPPYCYFGTNEGDGSDFGFWPSMSAIAELPKVSDPSEVEAMGEDCVFVNDHGNITVYNADGTVAWDCV
jgi:hypothetical protein